MSTTTFFITLTQITCPECGGLYALSQQYLDEAHEKGGFKQCWACPYCKQQRGYGDGEINRLKKQVAASEQSAKLDRARAEAAGREAEHFRHSRDAIKGVVMKIKKRVANGVCPCCKRSFQNLHNHMKRQHPKFIETEK